MERPDEERFEEYYEKLDEIEKKIPEPPKCGRAVDIMLDREFDKLEREFPDVFQWLKENTFTITTKYSLNPT